MVHQCADALDKSRRPKMGVSRAGVRCDTTVLAVRHDAAVNRMGQAITRDNICETTRCNIVERWVKPSASLTVATQACCLRTLTYRLGGATPDHAQRQRLGRAVNKSFIFGCPNSDPKVPHTIISIFSCDASVAHLGDAAHVIMTVQTFTIAVILQGSWTPCHVPDWPHGSVTGRT